MFDLKPGETTEMKRSNDEIQNVNEDNELLELLTVIGISHEYHKFLKEEISSKSIWKQLANEDKKLRHMGLTWGSISKFNEAYQRSKGRKHNKFYYKSFLYKNNKL